MNRLGRVLLVILVVVAGVLIVGDIIVKSIAERRMEEAMQTSLDLSSRPDVTVKGWPFILRAMQGEFSSVIVVADGVRAEGLDLRDVRLEFEKVRFSLPQIVSGNERRVRVGRGEGTAELTASELNDVLDKRGMPAMVDFTDGRVIVNSTQLNVAANAGASVDSGRLLITPEGGLETLEFELPVFTEGVTYSSARIQGSRAILHVEIGPTSLVF
jgi:LmeA-like phospholipid-binding